MVSSRSLGLAFIASAQAAPPNILVLLTDDQGWGDNEYMCENSTGLCPMTPHIRSLAEADGTALFHRFYSASSVCSPTRASIVTGRTNSRNCIMSALQCCQEDPAPGCSMSMHGALSLDEFTIAKAAKKSKLGDYATIHLGKWHLGDLWDKGIPSPTPTRPGFPVSSPTEAGYDEWMTTQAEVSNSMSNCGCFPVQHDNPGPKPPFGCCKINPVGDQCIVGGGAPSDWAYPCTNYYYPNSSDPRGVTDLQIKIPGDDSTFLIDLFEDFLERQIAAGRPWLAHICFHAIHEPHPAMPEFYQLYAKDPDYLGALHQWDVQIGRLLSLLKDKGVADDTVIFYTADNGPHQGKERTDIHWSTNFLRGCKASMWEGGIRVPGLVHYPGVILGNLNISMPAVSSDFMPTIMSILDVESDNPTWTMDGTNLLPLIEIAQQNEEQGHNGAIARPTPIGFWTYSQQSIIDNNWKILHNPGMGQCDSQAPYNSWKNLSSIYLLFDLENDYHELKDLSVDEPEQYQRMKGLLDEFLASVENSQANETKCGKYAPAPPPTPPSDECDWHENTGLDGSDMKSEVVKTIETKEDCCGLCKATEGCVAADFNLIGLETLDENLNHVEAEYKCHLKEAYSPKDRFDGSIACVPRALSERLV